MSETYQSTLPTARAADAASTLLFMAPEFWGDAVAEPATSSWTSLNLESVDETRDRWLGHDDLLFDDEERLVGFTVGRGPRPGAPQTRHRRSWVTALAGAVAVVAAFATALAFAGVLFVQSYQVGAAEPNVALAELGPVGLFAPALPEPLVGAANVVDEPVVIAPVAIPVASSKPRALRDLALAARERLATAASPEIGLRPRTAPAVAPAREPAEVTIPSTPLQSRRATQRRPRREATTETQDPGRASMTFDRDELLLPETLSSVQLRVALRQVLPLAANCVADDGPGRASVGLVIHGSNGRVTRARVSGPLATTTEGACIERALRRARFPRFTDSSLEITAFSLVLR